jgi:ethanolamine transporter EutH
MRDGILMEPNTKNETIKKISDFLKKFNETFELEPQIEKEGNEYVAAGFSIKNIKNDGNIFVGYMYEMFSSIVGSISEDHELIYDEDKGDYVAIKHNAKWLLLSLSFPLIFLWIFILDKFKIEELSGIFSITARIVTIILAISMILSIIPTMKGIFWLMFGCPEGYWE